MANKHLAFLLAAGVISVVSYAQVVVDGGSVKVTAGQTSVSVQSAPMQQAQASVAVAPIKPNEKTSPTKTVAASAVGIDLPRPESASLDDVIRMEAELDRINKQIAIKEASRKLTGDDSLPEVVSIIMSNDGASATVRYKSQMLRTLKVGDAIGRSGKVVSIDPSGVMVKSAKSSMYLPFYDSNASTVASQGTSMSGNQANFSVR